MYQVEGAQQAPLNVFLYLRTSTDEQDDSPAIQENRARQFCAEKGWTVVGVFQDIITGKAGIQKRPRFRQMLEEAAPKQVRGFVGLTFNRFLRSTKVKTEMEAELVARNLFIWGIDDNRGMGAVPGVRHQRASEKAMLNMTVAMDQYYSDFISDKIRDHHEHRVGNKLHHSGPPPFGYALARDAHAINGRWFDGWVPDDQLDSTLDGLTLAERLCWIFHRFLRTENLMDIAVELTKRGVPTPRQVQWNRLSQSERDRRLEIQAKNKAAGHAVMALPPSATWDSSVLSDMLRSRAYLGMVAYTPDQAKVPGKQKVKQWHAGRHAPLIDEALWERVQAILDQKHQARRKAPSARSSSLLGGMVKCACGKALTLTSKGQGSKQHRYRCNLRAKSRGLACDMKSMNGANVDSTAFRLLVRGMRVRLEEIRAAAPILSDLHSEDALVTEREHLLRKRARVLENFEDGLFGEGPTAKVERDSRLSPILKRLEELEVDVKRAIAPKEDDLSQALANIESLWEEFPLSVKREVLRAYVPGGFQVSLGQKVRAEVCGVLLEANILAREPKRPDPWSGGGSKESGRQVIDLPAALLSFPLVMVPGGVAQGTSSTAVTQEPASEKVKTNSWT